MLASIDEMVTSLRWVIVWKLRRSALNRAGKAFEALDFSLATFGRSWHVGYLITIERLERLGCQKPQLDT